MLFLYLGPSKWGSWKTQLIIIIVKTTDTEHFYYRQGTCFKDIFLFHMFFLCSSHDVVRGLMEAQEEEVTEEGINYVAMRNLFVREAREALDVKVEKKTRTKHVRESAERLELGRTVIPIHSGHVHVHLT